MEREVSNKKKKFVYLKRCKNLNDIQTAIKIVKESPNDFQIAVLKKIVKEYICKNSISNKVNTQHNYNTSILGHEAEYGIFDSPEVGKVFISGFLASTFLYKIDNKVLGEMSTGIYGILRGLGLEKVTVETALTDLKSSYFLLILRGENHLKQKAQNLLEV